MDFDRRDRQYAIDGLFSPFPPQIEGVFARNEKGLLETASAERPAR